MIFIIMRILIAAVVIFLLLEVIKVFFSNRLKDNKIDSEDKDKIHKGELIKCTVCDAYVSRESAKNCKRKDCPFQS